MLIIGHRGASADAPENTLAAFELAWQQGADGIEMDVHLSRDGRLLVHHDTDTYRTAGVHRILADTEADTLRRLDVGSWKNPCFADQRIPLLEEVLALKPDGLALVELKSGPAVAPALKRLALPDSVTLISFHLETLLACREWLPQTPCCLIVEATTATDGRWRPYSPTLVDLALRHGLAGLDPQHDAIDATLASLVQSNGLLLYTWTVNQEHDCRRLLDLGVDGVTSDIPGRLRTLLS